MIGILCLDGRAEADELRRELRMREMDAIELSWDAPTWAASGWDDVLVYFYSEPDEVRPEHLELLERMREARRLLPVVVSGAANAVPPEPISGLKGLQWDRHRGEYGALVRRCAALSAVRARNPDHNIMISYRVSDGTEAANLLQRELELAGFPVWRDVNRDAYDGDQNIQFGEEVREEIAAGIEQASIVVLLDTPQANKSPWIREEIKMANRLMVPIFPVVLTQSGDRTVRPRFRELCSLGRWRIATCPDESLVPGADTAAEVAEEIEAFLDEILRRRLRLPHETCTIYQDRGFDWSRNAKHAVFVAQQTVDGPLPLTVTHVGACSSHASVYEPEIEEFDRRSAAWSIHAGRKPNYCIFVLDDAVPVHDARELNEAGTGIDHLPLMQLRAALAQLHQGQT